jgi:hypothetical protein
MTATNFARRRTRGALIFAMTWRGASMATSRAVAAAGLTADYVVNFGNLAVSSFLALVTETSTRMATEMWITTDSTTSVAHGINHGMAGYRNSVFAPRYRLLYGLFTNY